MLQVLWEQGFIDVNNLKQYTIEGQKDAFGNLQQHTSLKYLLGNCTGFEEKELMLQSIGSTLGVTIDRTPKCHCKLAGEGIEYSWGCTKNAFWLMPLSTKRKKETSWETVRKCLMQDVLTTERVGSFCEEPVSIFVHIMHCIKGYHWQIKWIQHPKEPKWQCQSK